MVSLLIFLVSLIIELSKYKLWVLLVMLYWTLTPTIRVFCRKIPGVVVVIANYSGVYPISNPPLVFANVAWDEREPNKGNDDFNYGHVTCEECDWRLICNWPLWSGARSPATLPITNVVQETVLGQEDGRDSSTPPRSLTVEVLPSQLSSTIVWGNVRYVRCTENGQSSKYTCPVRVVRGRARKFC